MASKSGVSGLALWCALGLGFGRLFDLVPTERPYIGCVGTSVVALLDREINSGSYASILPIVAGLHLELCSVKVREKFWRVKKDKKSPATVKTHPTLNTWTTIAVAWCALGLHMDRGISDELQTLVSPL
eukprot:CAMPEP_0195511110 /NCGR_PEP_ID=MMETSP0794_2-20130614/3547_1 /TAXON_ID=515487 /ORGANISM="Stephanopyxis turris, Strain CCMP 815" /LENGTH=128 /DNA_ID=CAMNT_0040638657 /DNA_START=119 /DNA_END=505 /DNA_ORIENTATION=-